MNFGIKNLTDRIQITVFDKKKNECLGMVKLLVADLISKSAKEGYLGKWIPLLQRDEKKKEKYVGGDIFVEVTLDKDSVEDVCYFLLLA